MNEIAIIDADLIGRKNHRFPNLSCIFLRQGKTASATD